MFQVVVQLFKAETGCFGLAGDQNVIPPGFAAYWHHTTRKRPQTALGPVSHYRVADFLGCRKSDADIRRSIAAVPSLQDKSRTDNPLTAGAGQKRRSLTQGANARRGRRIWRQRIRVRQGRGIR